MGRYPCFLNVHSYFDCNEIAKVELMYGKNHPSTQNRLLGKLGVKDIFNGSIQQQNLRDMLEGMGALYEVSSCRSRAHGKLSQRANKIIPQARVLILYLSIKQP